jgi:hypothetical protein
MLRLAVTLCLLQTRSEMDFRPNWSTLRLK